MDRCNNLVIRDASRMNEMTQNAKIYQGPFKKQRIRP